MDSYATFGLVPCYTAMFITLFDPGSQKNFTKKTLNLFDKKIDSFFSPTERKKEEEEKTTTYNTGKYSPFRIGFRWKNTLLPDFFIYF